MDSTLHTFIFYKSTHQNSTVVYLVGVKYSGWLGKDSLIVLVSVGGPWSCIWYPRSELASGIPLIKCPHLQVAIVS